MATRQIATEIVLGGEKEFNSAMTAINSNLKTLRTDMAATSAEFDGNADSIDALTAKQKILAETAAQNDAKVDALRQRYEHLKATLGEDAAATDKAKQVYLQNAAGDRWGLNGENGVYVSSLAGFGYTLSPTYADLTRGFFLAVSGESEPQGTVPFTVYFTRNAYAVYQSFVDWLAAAGTVILCYNPTGDQEYRRDVDVNFLQKGELNEVGWLEVPSSFYVKTPWYKPYATTLSLETAGGDSSKRYDYVYDSSLMYGVDSSGSLAGELRGGGHIPGSLELSYYGAITNPKIRMVGNLSGKTFGICSVTAVLIASDRLEYSSRREQSYVRKVSADGTVTDLLDSLDLSTTPFPHIPVDEPVTISIEADAAFTGSADLTLFYYYRSV